MSNENTLATVRQFYGFNQSQLGERLGVTGEYINMIERGKRPFSDAMRSKLYARLGITPDKMTQILTAQAYYEAVRTQVIG